MSTSNAKHLIARDVQDLDSQITNRIQEIKELDNYVNNVEYTIKERVQQIAQLLEEKMRRAGTPEFINTICSLIIRMFADAGLMHRQNSVINALPDTYKLLRQSTSHLASSEAKPTEESSILLDNYTQALKAIKNSDKRQFTRRQMQDLHSDMTDASDAVNDFCTENKIETAGGDSHSWIDALYKHKAPAIPLEKAPDALDKPGDDAKEWFRLGNICNKIGQARMDYPNHDLVRLHKEVHAVRALCDLWEPLINRKYRYHVGQMNDMIYESVSQSGTAAASHSGVICADTINPKTGLPELRKITKEQLDAISLPFYNKMNHMMYYLPLIGEVTDLAFQQYSAVDAETKTYGDQTYLAKRAKEVGPKLQKIK